jgi:hypothetical protein
MALTVQIEKMCANDKLERMWKEAVKAYSKVIFQHSPGGTEKQ